MKKIIYYNKVQEWVRVISFLLPLFSFLMMSCSDDGYQSRLRELLIEDMTFECTKSTQEVVFRHEDVTNYDCQSSETWCEVAFDVVGNKLVVKVSANDTYDVRTATVTLADRKDSSAKRTFTVTQKRNTGLFLDKVAFEVPQDGGSVTVSLKSNVAYEVRIPSDCDWVTLSADAKTRGLDSTAFTLLVAENRTYRERTAVITVINTTENLSDKVTVYQPFTTVFNVDSTAFEIPMEGRTFTVNVESNIRYDVNIPSDCDWITKEVATKTRETTASALVFTAKENKGYKERHAVITLSNDSAGVSVPITVHQPFTAVFNADQQSFDVPMEGGTVTVNMESNVSYEVVIPEGCDWITQKKSSRTRGVQATAVTLQVKENTTYKDRDAVVTIQNKEAGVSVAVSIHQPFETVFQVDNNAFDVPMEGGNVTINLTSNISFDVNIPADCDWITLPSAALSKRGSKTRAATATAIVLRVKENPGYDDRDAIITISNKDAGAEIKVAIHQPFTTVFKADQTAFDVDMAGGTVTVNMESNVSYDVSIPADCDWISLPTAARGKTRATSTSAVVLRVKENPGYQDRDAVVTISNKKAGVSVGIYIHQPFTTEFKLDKTDIAAPMEGGTVMVNVESNVSYDVTIPSDCDWISQVSSSRTRASKSSVVMLRVSPNTSGRDRSAVITFSNSKAGVSAGLTVTQPFTANFSVDVTPLEIDELGGTLGVSVAANVGIDILPQVDWLKVGGKTGVGDGYWTQQIKVSPFTSKTDQRTGSVKFLYGAANQQFLVPVTQMRTLYITESNITLTEAGQTQALTLTNTKARSVVWSSSDQEVATVSRSGTVTAVASGEAVITVSSADGRYSDKVYVTVTIPESSSSEDNEEEN